MPALTRRVFLKWLTGLLGVFGLGTLGQAHHKPGHPIPPGHQKPTTTLPPTTMATTTTTEPTPTTPPLIGDPTYEDRIVTVNPGDNWQAKIDGLI